MYWKVVGNIKLQVLCIGSSPSLLLLQVLNALGGNKKPYTGCLYSWPDFLLLDRKSYGGSLENL